MGSNKIKPGVIISMVAVIFTVGCSSSPHRAEQLDTKMEKVAVVTGSSAIGVKDGDMIFQKKVLMSEEIRLLENETTGLEAKLLGGPRYYDNRGMLGVLKDCKVELAYIVGEKFAWSEGRDYVIPENENMKIGLDGNSIVGVSEEYLKDRLERFRGYKKVLQQRADRTDDEIRMCKSMVSQEKAKALNRQPANDGT